MKKWESPFSNLFNTTTAQIINNIELGILSDDIEFLLERYL